MLMHMHTIHINPRGLHASPNQAERGMLNTTIGMSVLQSTTNALRTSCKLSCSMQRSCQGQHHTAAIKAKHWTTATGHGSIQQLAQTKERYMAAMGNNASNGRYM